IAGEMGEALDGFSRLLHRDMPSGLKVNAFATAASIAANLEDWPAAFAWLDQSLAQLPQSPDRAARVLGGASYLHSLLGETGKAREFALRARAMVEDGDDPRAICFAVSDVALAEEQAERYAESERWRRRQLDACAKAGDRIFTANARYGVGKMRAELGHPEEALGWAREALAEFEAAGRPAGVRG